MKNVCVFLILLMTCLTVAYSQDENSKFDKNSFYFSAGLQINAKGGVNTNSIDGYENGFNVNQIPDFALTTFIPFEKESLMGLHFDIGYSTYSYKILLYTNNDIKSTYHLNYLTFSPYFCLMGVNLGINFGIPLAGEFEGTNFSLNGNTSTTLDTKDYNSLIELRLGGTIPVMKHSLGRLNVLINFGYVLSSLNENVYNVPSSRFLEFMPASGSLGVSYLFNISEL